MKSKDIYRHCKHKKREEVKHEWQISLTKIRRGNYIDNYKKWKLHVKWKRFCLDRNQEYFVPQKR